MRVQVMLFVLASSGAASAQEVDCANALTQIEMTYCAEQAYKAADGDLNLAYKLARAQARALDTDLGPDLAGAEAQLQAAQRAWIPYRDAACAAEGYQMRGGSGEAMLIYLCLERLTRARTEDLRAVSETN